MELVRSLFTELPEQARERLQSQYGVTAYDADVIVSAGPEMLAYYDTVAAGCGDGKRASSWIQQDVMRNIKEQGITVDQFAISADQLAALIQGIIAGELANNRARDVFDHMLANGVAVDQAMKDLGIEQVDDSEMESLVADLLSKNPKVVDDVKGGNQKAVGSLIGQARKANPNANPQQVRELALKMIEQL
jgi:aspartyl-tRNA(Asn)/glutamyl-tRNA(Gln) amidotransferase subunit B